MVENEKNKTVDVHMLFDERVCRAWRGTGTCREHKRGTGGTLRPVSSTDGC